VAESQGGIVGKRPKKYIPRTIRQALTIPDLGTYNGVPIALFPSYGHEAMAAWLNPDEREIWDALDIDDNEDFLTYQSLRREAHTRRLNARMGYDEERLDRLAESYFVEVERAKEE